MDSFKGKLINIGLIAAGLIVGLLLIEIIGRPFNLVFDAAYVPVDYTQDHDGKSYYDRDPELGHIPRMGREFLYSDFGTKHNSYPAAKRPGWKRVLLLGDSITAIGYTGQNLIKKSSKEKYEFWNCGVPGYSTFQELNYFKRYCSKTEPDQVILNFFLNDFDGTPVVLKDADDQYVVITPYTGSGAFHPWLFRNSLIYRGYLSLKIALWGRQGLREDVAANIKKLAEQGEKSGFDLFVVVYPWLDKYDEWPRKFKNQREDIIEILEASGLPFIDLKPLLDKSLERHPAEWARNNPADPVHPSDAFCQNAADYIIESGLLK